MASIKERLILTTVPRLVDWIMRLWFGTVRVEIINRDIYLDYVQNNRDRGSVVLGTWHRHTIFFFHFFRHLDNRVLMVSQSRDGELLARLAERLGYDCVRGSSTRSGGQALRAMIRYLRNCPQTAFAGTAMDGPQGPARICKPGLLAAAGLSGSWFIPMAWSGNRVITFRKAWDKTIVPRPFSKVIMIFEQPIKIPPKVPPAEMEKLRREVDAVLNRITDRVDEITGYKGER